MTFEEWFKDNFEWGAVPDEKLTPMGTIIKDSCRLAWNAAIGQLKDNLPDPNCDAQESYLRKIEVRISKL